MDELVDRLFAASGWKQGERLTPIWDAANVNRTTSMVGGHPWTSSAHPWPRMTPEGEDNPQWCSPLLQLNLRDLDLGFLAEFPPVLVQVWGNGIYPIVRTIALADTDAQAPDLELRPWVNKHLRYDAGSEFGENEIGVPDRPAPVDPGFYEITERLLGAYIRPSGPLEFSLMANMSDEVDWIISRISARADETKLDFLQKIVAELSILENDGMAGDEGVCGMQGQFGGQQFRLQGPHQSARRHLLYTPSCGDNGPLFILWDGALWLFWTEQNGQFTFHAYADR
jgi:hypothetical protein